MDLCVWFGMALLAASPPKRRLASIEAGHRHALRDAELDASPPDAGGGLPSDADAGGGGGVLVAGASLACGPAKVLVGPVVGLVTGDAARVLLEVDRATEVGDGH